MRRPRRPSGGGSARRATADGTRLRWRTRLRCSKPVAAPACTPLLPQAAIPCAQPATLCIPGELLREAPRTLRDDLTARVANTTWATASATVGRHLGATGISLEDATERRARVLVLDAAEASADLSQLGTISNLAAAAVRQWAPCLLKSTDKAALEQRSSIEEHMPHEGTCTPEQRDLAEYAVQGSNPRLAGQAPGRPRSATHRFEPCLGQVCHRVCA